MTGWGGVEQPRSYLVQGRTVTLPVEVRDASNVYATYVVPSAAVRELLPQGLQIAELLPGRALCTIGAIEYRDNDLGRYEEMVVAFMVQHGNPRPRPLLDFLSGRAGAYIHRLPVNGSFTCEAGTTIWGYPKTVEEITIRTEGRRRAATLVCGGTQALTFTARYGGRMSFRDKPLDTYSHHQGVLRRTPFTSSGSGVGIRVGGASLVLGSHPVADELRSLGLPRRPLMSGSVEHLRAHFGAPEVLSR